MSSFQDYTCKKGHIHSYLPITFPFPLKIKQEHCFCVIKVPPMKGAVLFEKVAMVFKHKISFSESLGSRNTPTFKIRKNKTPYQYFSSTTAACHILNQKLLFWKLQQSCATILCQSSGFQMLGHQKGAGVPWKFSKPQSITKFKIIKVMNRSVDIF